MLATVKKVEERQGRSGPYWLISLEGEERPLYCWDRKLGPAILPGQLYELEVDSSGRFPKVKALRPVASANGLAPGEKGEGEAPVTVRLVLTLDMEALQEAVDLLAELLRKARG
jgi:hypothetical protein